LFLAFVLFALTLGFFVLRDLPEDVLELVKQIRVLVVQSAGHREVTPLHPSTQRE
jgi:hypothetical protein